MRWALPVQLLVLGMVAGCGGGSYRCAGSAEGLMAVPPATVMGGQIEGRREGSFVLVSHRVWGVLHVVLMLGPDLARQTLLSGYIDAVPERSSCTSEGDPSNGVQVFNESSIGNVVQLDLEIDSAQGLLSGTLRDYGANVAPQNVTGAPIVGAVFSPAEPSNIAAVHGDWVLGDALGRPAELSVWPDGSLQLKLPECSYSGSLEPINGLNLLGMKLRSELPCLLDTDETEGFVVVLPLTDGRQQLMLWGVDNGWGLVVQAIGRR
jgi:hypothetical protein